MKGLSERVNLNGTNVLVRVDLNVPLAKVRRNVLSKKKHKISSIHTHTHMVATDIWFILGGSVLFFLHGCWVFFSLFDAMVGATAHFSDTYSTKTYTYTQMQMQMQQQHPIG